MRETISTGCAIIATVIGALALILVIGLALGVMQLPFMNINRVVIQHSLQYVQTHQTMMLDYYADYTRATDDAHKNAAVLEVCQQAALLIEDEWPNQVRPFIATHCH